MAVIFNVPCFFFGAEACFLTRNENEWYREPISSKITSEEDLPPEVASVSD